MISFPDVLRPLSATCPAARIVLLEQDLALIPVTNDVAASLHCSHVRLPPETGFRFLTPGVYEAVRVASMAGPIAYIEANYLGHDGQQAAAIWAERAIAYGPTYLHPTEPYPADGATPITETLRRLGVMPDGRDDEFIAVGLGRHINTTDWHRSADPASAIS